MPLAHTIISPLCLCIIYKPNALSVALSRHTARLVYNGADEHHVICATSTKQFHVLYTAWPTAEYSFTAHKLVLLLRYWEEKEPLLYAVPGVFREHICSPALAT